MGQQKLNARNSETTSSAIWHEDGLGVSNLPAFLVEVFLPSERAACALGGDFDFVLCRDVVLKKDILLTIPHIATEQNFERRS